MPTPMRWLALALLPAFLLPSSSAADPIRSRILRALEVQALADATEVRIRFSVPVRYLRHSPPREGASIEIQVEPLALERSDALAARAREALRPPAGAPVPLQEVTYEGGGREAARLDVRFTKRVRFEVRQGSDFRSVVLTLPRAAEPPELRPAPPAAAVPVPAAPVPPAPAPAPARDETARPVAPRAVDIRHPFAVQVKALRAGEPLPDVGDLLPQGRLYTISIVRDGTEWRRLRLGFFPTLQAAEAVRDALRDRFPDAFVVEAPLAEREGSQASALATEPPARTPAGITASAPAPAPQPPSDPGKLGALVQAARDALTAGELDRAIPLLSQVLTLPENEHSQEAKELLGVARERKGQLAHARAEYEEFLTRYPDGEGAERVRQRLAALLTVRERPAEPLREARAGDAARRPVDVFGSVSTSYRRDERSYDEAGRLVADDSLYSDLFLETRGQAGRYDLRSQLAGSYIADFSEADDDDWRGNALFLELVDREGPLSGTLGRQFGNSGGVLGRFDGAKLDVRLTRMLSISAVGGFPVDPYISNGIDTRRYFSGASLDVTGLFEGFDAQLYAIEQRAEGLLDRRAVGGEFSYARDDWFLAGLVDYDIHFGALDTALLSGNWRVTDATTLNFLLDRRHIPALTTSNALLGQTDDSLDDLRERFSRGELEDLAEDRTARSDLASVGVTQRLSERFQVAADVSVSDLSGTPPSGGVEGFEGTGRQYAYLLQLIGTDLTETGDVGTIGLRHVDAEQVDVDAVLLSLRYPVTRRLRLTPMLNLERRTPRSGERRFAIEPGLRLDHSFGPFTVDAEVFYEWSDGELAPGVGDESGYTVMFGIRYDF